MKIQIYQVLHVLSVILLLGFTFSAFAAPKPERKRVLSTLTGVLALVVLVSGFGLISTLYANHFALWMFVKLGAWLGISALGGVAFRRASLAGLFTWIVAALVALAVYTVYVGRF